MFDMFNAHIYLLFTIMRQTSMRKAKEQIPKIFAITRATSQSTPKRARNASTLHFRLDPKAEMEYFGIVFYKPSTREIYEKHFLNLKSHTKLNYKYLKNILLSTRMQLFTNKIYIMQFYGFL